MVCQLEVSISADLSLTAQNDNLSNMADRAVFKWLITWLRLLRLVIGLKESRQFSTNEKQNQNQYYVRLIFSRASRELQLIARNFDWFIALFVPVLIGRSNCFGFGFSTVFWKPL